MAAAVRIAARMIPLLTGGLLLSACASHPTTAGAPGKPAASMSTQAGTGLGLIGPETPELLKSVALAPYAAPDPSGCVQLGREIAALDEVLGPDVDIKPVPADRGAEMRHAAGDALVGMVPYRGVMRWMSGAGKQEHDRALAVLAGAARRGFLKGLQLAHGCKPAEHPEVRAAGAVQPAGDDPSL